MELCLLSHVVCFCAPDLCGLLLSHVFASICFWLSFLLYYLDNCVCYLVLQSLDQPSHCPVLNSLVPLFPSLWSLLLQFDSSFPSHCLLVNCHICCPARTILVIKSSSIWTPDLPFRTSVISPWTFVPIVLDLLPLHQWASVLHTMT